MKRLKKGLVVASCLLLLFGCSKKNQKDKTTKNSTTINQTTTNQKTTNRTTTKKVTTKQAVYYDVTFVDYNETVLLETKVKEGEVPTFTLTNPTRSKDSDYYYEFSGWSPELSAVTSNTTYIAQYNAFDLPYTIIFNLDGGSSEDEITTIKTDEFSSYLFNFNITKKGHTFIGWSYKGEIIFNNEGELINTPEMDSEMTFIATYTKNTYQVVLGCNNNKAGSITGGGTYYYGDEVTIDATASAGYSFSNITSGGEVVATEVPYNFNMEDSVINLTVNFSANTNTKYTVKHYLETLDGGTYEIDNSATETLYGTTDTYTSAIAKTYTGFESLDYNQVIIKGDGSSVVSIYYDRVRTKLTLTKNIKEAGTVTGEGTYLYGQTVIIQVFENSGYKFKNISNGNYLVTTAYSCNVNIGVDPINYTVTFNILSFKITLDNQASGVTVTGVTSGSTYQYNTEITLEATGYNEDYTLSWTRSDGVATYLGSSCTFNVPANDLTITVILRPYKLDLANNKIYFGYYPQTKVTDSKTLSELNSANGVSPRPTSLNSYSWTSYGYYSANAVNNYTWYIDIDLDNDGRYDYRGVYFSLYRPQLVNADAQSDPTVQSAASVKTNQYYWGYSSKTIHWFKYEMIEWDILEMDDGKTMLASNLLLDSREFETSSGYGAHNGGTGYANNYALSNIRKWLINDFYNTTFNELEKEIIQLTHVDNSFETTNNYNGKYTENQYVCEDTDDYVFLLSYEEIMTYYKKNSSRKAYGTDYAKAQGLYKPNSDTVKFTYWISRSPEVSSAEYISSCYGENAPSGDPTYWTCCGIRPALWIEL